MVQMEHHCQALLVAAAVVALEGLNQMCQGLVAALEQVYLACCP